MAKRRKKPPRPGQGYDYALLPIRMAVGGLEFPQLLTEADILVIAYGSQYCSLVESQIPYVMLVGRRAEPLLKAFQQFKAWSEDSDGDAVDLTIVFRADGGYLVGVGPETERLEQRCFGYDRTFPPVVAAATWVKTFETRGPHVRSLREYCQGLIRPFYVGAATYNGVTSGADLDPALIRPIPDCPRILKFSATFADENTVAPGTQPWLVLQASRRIRKRSRPPSPLHGAHLRRSTVLKTHFPVTLERIRCEFNATGLLQTLVSEGLRDWQIQQAICNLVLSSEVAGCAHFVSVPSGELDQRICHALQRRFEEADGNSKFMASLTPALIWAQAEYDARVLLGKAGQSSGLRNLGQVLRELRRRRLLDPEGEAAE